MSSNDIIILLSTRPSSERAGRHGHTRNADNAVAVDNDNDRGKRVVRPSESPDVRSPVSSAFNVYRAASAAEIVTAPKRFARDNVTIFTER